MKTRGANAGAGVVVASRVGPRALLVADAACHALFGVEVAVEALGGARSHRAVCRKCLTPARLAFLARTALPAATAAVSHVGGRVDAFVPTGLLRGIAGNASIRHQFIWRLREGGIWANARNADASAVAGATGLDEFRAAAQKGKKAHQRTAQK